MDDSFSQWRGNDKSLEKTKTNRDSSIILSDSDEERNESQSNDQRRLVIESSESSDTEDDLKIVQRTRALDEPGSRKSPGTHESSKSASDESQSSDDDIPVSRITADTDDDISSPVIRQRRIRQRMILDDSEADVSRQIEEQDEHSQTHSDASEIHDTSESSDHSDQEGVTSRFDVAQNKITTDQSKLLDIFSIRKKQNTETMLDDALDKVKSRSKRRSEQSLILLANPDISYDNENSESPDHRQIEDEASGSFENGDTEFNLNSKENSVGATSLAERWIDVNHQEHRSEEQDENYLSISDDSEVDDTYKREKPVPNSPIETRMGTHIASSKFNDSEDGVIVRDLVKKEVGVGNIDPLVAQQRAILTCNIEQVKMQLAKSKMLLNMADIAMLPDKGEKLRRSVDAHKVELQKLSEQLESLPKIGTPKSQFKPLPSPDVIRPPPWKMLSEPMEIKQRGVKALATHEKEQALTMERLEDLHGSLNARPGEDERAQDPKGLKICLMPHQQHALAWLLWREKQKPHGGILADDMGLGKTLTMISLIMTTMANQDLDDESDEDSDEWVHRKKEIRPKGGTLVICPASLLSQWEGEINRRVKSGILSVELFHGTHRETVPRRLAKNDVVITTYNLISREYKDNSILYKINWRRVILDEAHIVRNHKSQASEAVCNLFSRSRWALTGTPIQNKELDLYSLLKFLKCSPFDDIRVWKRWVDNKNAHGHQRLGTLMKTLMLRRTKQELQAKGGLQALPDKNLEEIHIKLDPDEQLVYEKVLVFSRTLFAQFLHQRAEKNHMFELNAGKFDTPTFLQKPKDTQFTKVQNQLLARHADVKAHEILVLLLRLRQVCCHPALIHAMLDQEDLKGNDIVDEAGPNSDIMSGLGALNLEDNENIDPNEIGVDRRVVQNLLTSQNPVFEKSRQSSKIRAVLDTIQKILDKGDKLVIVSQWTSMLTVIQSHLKTLKGATFDIFSGQVPVKNRQHIVESFNKVGSAPQILLLSLTAGGVGLNLVGGNHLLLLDIHWNPQLEAQAQDRIFRVGQTKSVYIYKFICLDTVEQRIKALQEKKLAIAQGVLTGADTAATASKLTLDDLKSLFSL